MVANVVAEWQSQEKLVLLGAGGVMAKVGNQELDREDIHSNVEVLAPIVRHLGFLASIIAMQKVAFI